MTTAILGAWGKVTAVRFPQHIAEKLQFEPGQKVEVIERHGECVIRKPRTGVTLDDCLREWDGVRYELEECDWGDPKTDFCDLFALFRDVDGADMEIRCDFASREFTFDDAVLFPCHASTTKD